MGKHEAKKSGSKPDPDRIILAAAILQLVNVIIQLIKEITD